VYAKIEIYTKNGVCKGVCTLTLTHNPKGMQKMRYAQKGLKKNEVCKGMCTETPTHNPKGVCKKSYAKK
jgi:hypothetical protein